MCEILIGTSGFFYDDWKGEFYPTHTAKKNFLEFYAKHFKTLELNFSYYKMPNANQSEQMIAKSNGKLVFVVKAFRQMTHEISELSRKELPPLFIEGIAPLIKSERLGGGPPAVSSELSLCSQKQDLPQIFDRKPITLPPLCRIPAKRVVKGIGI